MLLNKFKLNNISIINASAKTAVLGLSCFALISCGGSDGPTYNVQNDPTVVKVPATPAPSPSPTPDASPTPDSTPTPTPSPTPTDDSTDKPVDAETYSISGSVEGLTDGTISITLNDGTALEIDANNGSSYEFTFTEELEQSADYDVVISDAGDTMNKCAIFNGEDNVGTMDIDDIVIKCVEKEVIAAINAGGPAYVSPENGIEYSADVDFTGGDIPAPYGSSISGTQDQELYKTERFGEASSFYYDIDLADGTYDLTLHFSELYFNGTAGNGDRVFDVEAEGESILMGYNPFAESGMIIGRANVETFEDIEVTGGSLRIDFNQGPGNPVVSAIVVEGYPEITND